MGPETIEATLRNQAQELKELNRVARDILESAQRGIIVQKVVHTGPSALIGASIAVGFCAMMALVIFAIWAVPEIHDLRAWKDIHQGRIDKIDSWKSNQEKQK